MPNQFHQEVAGGAGHWGGHCHLLRQTPLRHPKARCVSKVDMWQDMQAILAE